MSEQKLSDTAKKKVLTKYPSAKIEKDGCMFFVYSGKGDSKKDLGAGFSREGAWCSAKCLIEIK